MYVSLGKTNPEASWTILTASWCPVVLILRPEVFVGSHCAPCNYKGGLTNLFKIALWSQMATSALVITSIFQRARKKEGGREEGDMSLLIKVPKASQA